MEYILQEKFVCCCDGKIEIRENNPYFRLLFSILSETSGSTKKIINNIYNAIYASLSTLRSEAITVLSSFYGLEDNTPKTEKEVSAALGLSEEKVHKMIENALLDLQHQRRSNFLSGVSLVPPLREDFFNYPYLNTFRTTIISEIKNLVSGHHSKTVYWDAIARKNGFDLQIEMGPDYSIEEMGLSVPTFNRLKRAGINFLGQLKCMTTDDFMQNPFLGKKCYEELLPKIQEFSIHNLDGSKYLSIIFTHNGTKTVYKYFDGPYDKIATSLFSEIFCNSDDSPDIFSSYFSPTLIELLLLKGYFFGKDVYFDADKLVRELIAFGFEDLAEEITCFKIFYDANDSDARKKVYLTVKPSVVNLVVDSHCTSIDELLRAAEATGCEEALHFIQGYKEYVNLM